MAQKPQEKDGPWFLGYFQGIAAAGLGLAALTAPDAATYVVGVLIAVYLLVAGFIQMFRGWMIRRVTRISVVYNRGLVGIVIGAVILFMALFEIGSLSLGYTILAIGLIVYGALGLWIALFRRVGKRFGWGPVIANGVLIALGIGYFVGRLQGWDLQALSGWALLIAGGAVTAWTYAARGEEEEAATIP